MTETNQTQNITKAGTYSIPKGWQSNDYSPEDVEVLKVTLSADDIKCLTIGQEILEEHPFISELQIEVESMKLIDGNGRESNFWFDYKHPTIKLFRDNIAYLYVWGKSDQGVQVESVKFYINKDHV